jgi:hypothetical protein
MAIKFTEKVGSKPTLPERRDEPASSPAAGEAAKKPRKKLKAKKQAGQEPSLSFEDK